MLIIDYGYYDAMSYAIVILDRFNPKIKLNIVFLPRSIAA